MRKKTLFVIFTAALILSMALITLIVPVFAQEEPVTQQPGPEVSFGWVVVSWLVYSIAGLIASVSGGQNFDGFKFARTLLFTLLVAILALALHITPVQATTTYGSILEQVVTVLLNTGPCTVLIYAFNKLYETIMNLKTKLETAKLAAATSPPKT